MTGSVRRTDTAVKLFVFKTLQDCSAGLFALELPFLELEHAWPFSLPQTNTPFAATGGNPDVWNLPKLGELRTGSNLMGCGDAKGRSARAGGG